jgi:hypothetical protein
MGRGSDRTGVAVGQLRRQTMLGSTATYRVAAVQDEHVVLEVWHVPGLRPGETLRVTRAAAESMELLIGSSVRGHGPAADAA